MQSLTNVDSERAELERLLSSKPFSRAKNFGRFLAFVSEKYFEGAGTEVKEYSIAVEALGRPANFDPQTDTIVRVTAHTLRRRLEEYYATEGFDHAIQIVLHPGHYVPEFVHRRVEGPGATGFSEHESEELVELTSMPFPDSREAEQITAAREISSQRVRRALGPLVFVVLAAAVTGGWLVLVLGFYNPKLRSKTALFPQPSALAVLATRVKPGIYALVGEHRAPYFDSAGNNWQEDKFCVGGDSFSVTGHTILGSPDVELFAAGRRGIFRCSYPVAAGVYELHLLFAETFGLKENARHVSFSINGGSPHDVDVVDDAAGDDVATSKIYTGVEPERDALIHVDFFSPQAFVNAIEILPGAPHRMLPVRIAVGNETYRDKSGNVWLRDRYYFGGNLSRFAGDLSRLSGTVFRAQRIGHFHYIIPVREDEKYTLKLYFLEQWFGAQNGGSGGVGSRVFNVSLNGTTLLKNFDIYAEGGAAPLVKSFSHVEPTPQGKLELYFTPSVNYPTISAIEVLPE